MKKFYIELHSEAYEELEIEAETQEEAEQEALEITELEDPVIYTVMDMGTDE